MTGDGGTAFPMQDSQAIHAYAIARIEGITDVSERDRVYTLARAEAIGGMSLRDYFAAKAMQGYVGSALMGVAAQETPEARAALGDELPTIVAEAAYKFADAMLIARGAT